MKKSYNSWSDENILEGLKSCLDSDRVAITTTDTVLGLLAPLTMAGFQALNRIKGRQEKPYLILASDVSKLGYFVNSADISQAAQCLIGNFWPGPLTLIFKARQELPNFVKSFDGRIALRIPQHDGLQKILMGYPGLFSTSANLTGQRVANVIDEVDPAITENCGFFVGGAVGNEQPSTIIDCSGEFLHIVREGAYSKDALSRLCGVRFD